MQGRFGSFEDTCSFDKFCCTCAPQLHETVNKEGIIFNLFWVNFHCEYTTIFWKVMDFCQKLRSPPLN